MRIIGLCGGSGSGKGTVSSILSDYGIPSIDTDLVYRDITSFDSACLRDLVSEYGEIILTRDGALDRAALGRLVFESENAELLRARLNEITHTHILNETMRRLSEMEKVGIRIAIVDAPLLFESGFYKHCDKVVAVIADDEIRLSRIVARDGISRDAAQRRLQSQIPNDVLVRRADYVIENNGDISDLKHRIDELIDKIII